MKTKQTNNNNIAKRYSCKHMFYVSKYCNTYICMCMSVCATNTFKYIYNKYGYIATYG